MATHKIFLLPGDGIGPEVMTEVEKVAAFMGEAGLASFEFERGLVGGAAYDAHGASISEEHMALAQAADAVLFGAVGGPKWDAVPYDVRPEAGLLRLRKDLGLFANLRPAICYPALADASSLKREIVEDLDIMIVRELTGGVYFGEPKQIIDLGNGQKRGIDTQVYDTYEIERISRVAFELARTRKKKVSSAEKRNVMKTGVLWNEVVTRIHAAEYPEIKLEHVLADNCAMQLVRWPKQYDVIVTDNLFGDIITDLAGAIAGGIGYAASANLNPARTGPSMFEPVHGAAHDIEGMNKANPAAAIRSAALMLDFLGEEDAAAAVNAAVNEFINSAPDPTLSTTQVGDAIAERL